MVPPMKEVFRNLDLVTLRRPHGRIKTLTPGKVYRVLEASNWGAWSKDPPRRITLLNDDGNEQEYYAPYFKKVKP